MKLAQLFEAVKTESFIDAKKMKERWGCLFVDEPSLIDLRIPDDGPGLIAYFERTRTGIMLYLTPKSALTTPYIKVIQFNFILMNGAASKFEPHEYDEALEKFNELKREMERHE